MLVNYVHTIYAVCTMPNIQMTFVLPESLKLKAADAAWKSHKSLSEWIRYAIENQLRESQSISEKAYQKQSIPPQRVCDMCNGEKVYFDKECARCKGRGTF